MNKALEVTKTVTSELPEGQESYKLGETVTFKVVVKNAGNVTLQNISVTDQMQNAAGNAVLAEGESSTIESLGVGESATLHYTYKIQEGDIGKNDITNVATATSGNLSNSDETDPIDIENKAPEEEQKTSTLVVKKSLVRGNGDAYIAENATFYVALFSDPDRQNQNRVTEPKELKFVNESEATATFDNLPVGETYYVGETNKDGKLIGEDDESGTVVMEIDGKKFTVEIGTSKYSDEKFDAKVEIESDGSEKSFRNVLWETPIGFFKQFTLTKVVKDVDGNKIPYEGKFYVGIYTDPDCNVLAQGLKDGDGKPLSNPIELSFNKNSSKQLVIETPENGEYYLAETADSEGKKLDEAFGFTPSFAIMKGQEEAPGNKVVIAEDSQVDMVLTNTERELIDIGFDLKWDDYENRDNTRGDYQVALYAHYTNEDGAVTKTEQIGEPVTYDKDVLEGEWTNLYKYDLNGNEIKYTVKETNLPDKYTTNAGEGYGVEPDKEGIAHLKNEYRANEDKPETPTDDPNKGNDDSGDNIKDSDTPADDEAKDSDVQTGDSTNIMLLLAMMITSIMLGGIILLRARRKEIK